jgi:hypothetical protein
MTKFFALYRRLDRLNEAIARAEKYLSKHPAKDFIYMVPDDTNQTYNNSYPGTRLDDEPEDYEAEITWGLGMSSDDVLCLWLFVDKENQGVSGSGLCKEAASTRVLFGKHIPELIREADRAVNVKLSKVNEIIESIDEALAEHQANWVTVAESVLEEVKPRSKKTKP